MNARHIRSSLVLLAGAAASGFNLSAEDNATAEIEKLKNQLAQRDAELQAFGKQVEELAENVNSLTAQQERDAETITRLNQEKADAEAAWKEKLADALETQADDAKRKTVLELEQSFTDGYIAALRDLKLPSAQPKPPSARRD